MNIIEVRSDKIYEKIMNSSKEKRNDIYRYELMKHFEFKWECINVPIKAKQKNGFENITAYLYGDEMAEMQGYFPVGLPYCAGYACGYHMIKYYLKKTGKSIVEATLLPYEDIIKEIKYFWD